MSRNSVYLTNCSNCAATTSKAHAKKHDGLCKSCAAGNSESNRYYAYKCSQCGVTPISRYQHDHDYVCSSCYRENDPVGYSNEVRFGE